MEEDGDDDDDEFLCFNSDTLNTGKIFQILKKNSYSTQLRVAVLQHIFTINTTVRGRNDCILILAIFLLICSKYFVPFNRTLFMTHLKEQFQLF